MKSAIQLGSSAACAQTQRGVVLFFALISLVAIMLAAVALIRSVDTGTIIAGNLALKQAATTSGDAGTEGAMTWVDTTYKANTAKNMLTDATHPLNISDATKGYYSNLDPALDLFADSTWSAITAVAPTTDSAGNTVRYVVQRACRVANVAIKDADCMFSGAALNSDGQEIQLPQDVCEGAGCPVAGQSPMIRVTSKVTGPRNTVSYVQAFVY